MFRNPVGEFSLAAGTPSRRAFRPECEVLEERIVLDNTATPNIAAPGPNDAAAGFVGSLTNVITNLALRLGKTLRSAQSGSVPVKNLHSQALAFQRLATAIQQVEQQVERTVGSNDPTFQGATRLFNLALSLLNSKIGQCMETTHGPLVLP